jgi:hypothetical protein
MPRAALSSLSLLLAALAIGCGDAPTEATDAEAPSTASPPAAVTPKPSTDGVVQGEPAADPDATEGLGADAIPRDHEAAVDPPMQAEAMVGALTVKLQPSSDRVRVYLVGADGAEVAATGEAEAVLRTEGEADQSISLTATEGHWSGAAALKSAVGYEAEVTLPVEGARETVNLRWGFVVEEGPPSNPTELPEGKTEPPGRADADGGPPDGAAAPKDPPPHGTESPQGG